MKAFTRFIIISFIVFSSSLSFAETGHDTVLIKHYYGKIKYCFNQDLNSAMLYMDSINRLLKEIDYPKGEAILLNIRGNIAWMHNNFDSAEYYYNRAIEKLTVKNNEKFLDLFYSNLGALYLTYSKYPQAEEALLKAYELAEKIDDKKRLIKINVDLANLNSRLSKYNKAVEYDEQALKLSEETGDSINLPYLTNSMAILYLQLGLNDLSLEYFRKALYFNKITKGRDISYSIYINLGNLFDNGFKNYDSASFYLKKAIEICRNSHDTISLEDATLNYSSILFNKGDVRGAINATIPLTSSMRFEVKTASLINLGVFMTDIDIDSAQHFLNKGLKYSLENNNWSFAQNALNQLIYIDSLTGDFKSSYLHFKEYINIQDSINTKEFKRTLAEIKTKYETEKNVLEKINLEKNNKLLEENIKRKTVINYLYTGLFILSIVLISILLYVQHKKSDFRKALLISNEELQASEKNLQKMNEKLEELNKMKSTLLSIISHDLRARVAPANQLINLLQDEYAYLNDEERLEIIKSIRVTSDSVLLLTSNLLDWANLQFESTVFEKEKVNIRELVSDELKELELTAEKKKISVENNIPRIEVLTNKKALAVIIRNLVSNALKFTEAGGKILLSGKKDNDFFEISIADNGIGMDKETLENIFDNNNSRVTYGTAKEKGSGLGLKLIKTIVEKLNGKIFVESKKGKGTKFTVRFPN